MLTANLAITNINVSTGSSDFFTQSRTNIDVSQLTNSIERKQF